MQYITLSRTDGITSKGAPYITLKLRCLEEKDPINVAVWDTASNQGPQVGQLVTFLSIRDNQGKKSAGYGDMMNIQNPSPEHPLYHFVPRPTSRQQWDETLQHLLSYCTNDALLRDIIAECAPTLYAHYLKRPAATSVHHAFPGGLVNHTWQMLSMLDGIYPFLPYKDEVKVERIILGVLFHDYGKLKEYREDGEPTQDMYLLGHIYISAHALHNLLEKKGVDEPEIARIVHCILSHHGELEYGSPVKPCMQEAIIINHLDNLSAKTDAISGAGHMEKVFALGTHVVKE